MIQPRNKKGKSHFVVLQFDINYELRMFRLSKTYSFIIPMAKKFKSFIFRNLILSGSVILVLLSGCNGPDRKMWTTLREGFQNPPDSAKPRVWWHWMNGNITKEGIKADFEWMHRVGIGGFQNFDASLETPQIVEKRLVYMTPEWKDAFRFTTELADSLGLEMAIAGSPGWSESGGPWVKPEQAMKKFVWSETRVEGGILFSGILPKPPSTTGVFQNMGEIGGNPSDPSTEYYADAAVVAFRVPEDDIPMSVLNPEVTSSGGKFSLAELTDGDLVKSTYLPPVKVGENAWVQYKFDKPQKIQSLTIVGGGSPGLWGRGRDPDNRALEASDDGKAFRKIIDIPVGGPGERTLTFEPVTAKFFRFTFITQPPALLNPWAEMFGGDPTLRASAPSGTQIAELVLHTVPQVNRFEEKAAFSTANDLTSALTRSIDNSEAISKDKKMEKEEAPEEEHEETEVEEIEEEEEVEVFDESEAVVEEEFEETTKEIAEEIIELKKSSARKSTGKKTSELEK